MVRACAVCGKTVEVNLASPCFPFCSPRCKTIDLGNWLTGRYAISEELSESEGANDANGANDEDDAQ